MELFLQEIGQGQRRRKIFISIHLSDTEAVTLKGPKLFVQWMTSVKFTAEAMSLPHGHWNCSLTLVHFKVLSFM